MKRAHLKITFFLIVLVCGMMPLTAYGAFVFDDATTTLAPELSVAESESFMLNVKFDAGAQGYFPDDDNAVKDIKIWKNDTFDSLPVPEQNESYQLTYRLAGWYMADGTEFTTQTPVTEPITLHASYWIEHDADVNDIQYFYSSETNMLTVTANSLKGTESSVAIPNTIDGVPVTAIDNNAFKDCIATGTLTISENVTYIGTGAFQDSGFTGMLNIPASVLNLDDYAFNGTQFSGLSFASDAQLQLIGESAFAQTSVTGALTIPDSVVYIGYEAFKGTNFASTLTFGTLGEQTKLETIDWSAFEDCGFYGSLTIPQKVGYIGGYAFKGNYTSLTNLGTLNLEYADSLAIIDEGAFMGCNGFNGALTFPDGFSWIGKSAFESTGFTSLNLGGGIQRIGDRAFAHCTQLSGSLVIPASLGDISQDGETLYGIGEAAFMDSFQSGATLQILSETQLTIGDYAFHKSGISGSVTFPATIVAIGDYAFAECESLNGSITFVSGGTSALTIGEQAFANTWLIGDLILPQRLESIGTMAFDNAYRTETADPSTLVLPIGLEHIGDSAFWGSHRIASVYIPGGSAFTTADAEYLFHPTDWQASEETLGWLFQEYTSYQIS